MQRPNFQTSVTGAPGRNRAGANRRVAAVGNAGVLVAFVVR
jgi:hypothetical protein